MYKIELLKSAAKEFRDLDDTTKRRITEKIDKLIEEPRLRGVRKLRGHKSLYRIRVGSFRIVYDINEEIELIQVTRIRHRSEVYK
jgi:mRNA interferase RelE/StbE